MRKTILSKDAWIPKIFPKKNMFFLKSGVKEEGFSLHSRIGKNNVRVQAPTPLQVFDLRLYTALLGIAKLDYGTVRGKWLSSTPKSVDGKNLRKALHIEGHHHDTPLLCVSTSLRRLAREMSYASSGLFGQYIMASLNTLSQCRINVDDFVGSTASFHMLSYIQQENKQKNMLITLNPYASEVISKANGYTPYSLEEARLLRHNGSILLHYSLSAVIDRGKTILLNRKTLEAYIYPQAALSQDQKTTVNKALEEIKNTLHWPMEKMLSVKGEEQLSIMRPTSPQIASNADKEKNLAFQKITCVPAMRAAPCEGFMENHDSHFA